MTCSVEADTVGPRALSYVQILPGAAFFQGSAHTLQEMTPSMEGPGAWAQAPLLPTQGPSLSDPRGLVGHRDTERTWTSHWGHTRRTPSGLCAQQTCRGAGGGAGTRVGPRMCTTATAQQRAQLMGHLTRAPNAARRANSSRMSM